MATFLVELLCSCNRDHMAHKPKTCTNYCFYRKSLSTPVVGLKTKQNKKSLKMLSCHLAPDTKWVISMIKLSFNYSVRCQWCTPFWHYNGLRLLRKCWERQGAITLSKCSHLVTLFPVHQLIFQVAQNSRVRWGGRQGHPLRVMSATQGFSWFCPNTTNSPFFKKVHWLSKGMKF